MARSWATLMCKLALFLNATDLATLPNFMNKFPLMSEHWQKLSVLPTRNPEKGQLMVFSCPIHKMALKAVAAIATLRSSRVLATHLVDDHEVPKCLTSRYKQGILGAGSCISWGDVS